MVNARDGLTAPFHRLDAAAPVLWTIADGLTPYPDALAHMDERAAAIAEGRAGEEVWLVEHTPLYTAGTSARPGDLVAPGRFPVFETGRGGQYTYHGPGQRVAYAMLDLRARRQDLRAYVAALEDWIIGTLGAFNIRGERREDRVGVPTSRACRTGGWRRTRSPPSASGCGAG
jgi:lipoyl(octanoyl) transferase